MIVHCQICKELISGPDAPPELLDSETRRAFEFAALYQPMARHLWQHHAELKPLLVGLLDQYALSLVSNVFGIVDAEAYQQLQGHVRSAVWATLNQEWRFASTPLS